MQENKPTLDPILSHLMMRTTTGQKQKLKEESKCSRKSRPKPPQINNSRQLASSSTKNFREQELKVIFIFISG